MHSGAIDYLLDRRLHEVDKGVGRWKPATGMALGALVGAGVMSESWGMGLAVALLTACYLCVGLYFYRSWHCAALLNDLRRRGALDELLSTPLGSREIVDGIARRTVREGARLLALPCLVVGTSLVLLGEWPLLIVLAGLLPIYLGLTGYGLQAWNAWQLKCGFSWVGMFLGCLLVYFPALPLGAAVISLGERSPEAALALVTLWCFTLLLTLRWLVNLGLERGQALEDRLRSASAFKAREGRGWTPSQLWDKNPVLARSLAHVARPGLYHSAMAVLGLGLSCFYGAAFGLMLFLDSSTLLPVLLLISLGGGSSAAWMAANQIKAEQDTGTFELTKASGLPATTCTDGWAAAAWLRPMLVALVLFPFVACGALEGDCPPILLAGGLLWGVVTIMSGAYAGVAARLEGDLQGDRISARLLLLSLAELVLLFSLMMLWLPHPWLSQGLLLIWSGTSLLMYRRRAIAWLESPGSETRFSAA